MTEQDKTEVGEMISAAVSNVVSQLKDIIIEVNQNTITMLRAEIKESEENTRALIQDVDHRMQLGFENVNARLDTQEEHLAGIEAKVEKLENQSIKLFLSKQDKANVVYED